MDFVLRGIFIIKTYIFLQYFLTAVSLVCIGQIDYIIFFKSPICVILLSSFYSMLFCPYLYVWVTPYNIL